MKKKQALGYIRVSTDKQVEGSSLENQVDRIKAYCSLYDLELTELISDEGASGRNTKRDGFQKVMDKVKNKECDAVIVYSLSRFARSTVDALTNIEILNKNNVAFHSLTEKIDTSSAQGKFFLTIISALAELESNQTSERITSVKANNKAKLKTYSSPVFGFDSKKEEPMVVNESEMKTVLYIKEQIKVLSYSKIANQLNSMAIPTKNNKQWYASTIYAIANNEVYNNVEIHKNV